jgi:hypothetical protein
MRIWSSSREEVAPRQILESEFHELVDSA